MRKFIIAVLPLGLALIASQSDARTFTFPETGCRAILPSAGCIDYSQYGVNNVCSGTATVECALPISYPSAGANVTGSAYFAYDRNSAADVSCSLQRTDFSGSVLFSTTVNTTGGGAGAGLQTETFSVSQLASGYWRLRCDIPGVQTAGWFSHVSNIYIQTSE